MLNGNDLRNSVTAMEATTTTTTKMSSAHNLKTQPQTQSNPKESNSAASSSSSSTKTVFQCIACQKEFVTEKYLCMHMSLHRAAQGAAARGAVAPLSSSSSTASGGAKLTDPKTAIRTSSSSSSPSSSEASIKLVKSDGTGSSHWTCKICSKTFAQSSNYKNHIRTHSDERPFVCNTCSIGFKERYHLKKHILFKHSDELKEECRVCGKRFKDSTAVRAHERIHSEERPYGCQRCDKTFKTSECLWHHENRSRTCGKLLRAAAGGGGAGGGGGLVDSGEMNPGPRFRRGRHPSKRLALSKTKAAAAAAATEDGGQMGDASVGLTLDHVEEISASVKIELEREIPDYYFRTVPGFCSYDFESMTEVPASDKGTMLSNGLLRSVRPTDGLAMAIDPDEVSLLHHPSLSAVVATVTTKSPLDQFAGPYWGSGEWTSSTGAGVLLGSPSRPVSASYDMIGDAYCPVETADNSWKQQDASSSRRHEIYVGGEMMTTTKQDFVKSQNLTRCPQRNVRQLQLTAAAAEVVSSATDPSLRRFGDLVMQPAAAAAAAGDVVKTDVHRQGLGGGSPAAHTQMHQLTPCSYAAGDYRSTDKSSHSAMTLTCMTETQWPPINASTDHESVSPLRIFDGRSSEFSSALAIGSYHASIAGVPTAVVAPFKREKTNRPLEVSISETEQQPVKNSLPPFETFAPMTLRAQKSNHAASKATATPPQQQQQRRSPPTPPPPPPDGLRFIPPFTYPSYSFDSSVADQCPTIQKYLLKGHPNASIKISHSSLLLPGEQTQGQNLCHVPFNRHSYRLSPRDNGRHPEGVPSAGLFLPLDGGRQQQAPEFRAAFLSETRRMRPGGVAAMAGGQLGGLVSSSSSTSSPLPARMLDDATGGVSFVQMMSPLSMMSTSQSAMLQRLSGNNNNNNNIGETTNAMSVDIYQQI